MPNVEKIREYLSDCSSDMDLFVYECVTSTNDISKEIIQNGCNKETVIIAKKQTAGRGRRGRSFFSPDASGVYMSIILRPTVPFEMFSLLTPAAAVATAKAAECVSGKKVDIKWINDIFLDGKKICGILCETSFENNKIPQNIIVGIGINLCEPQGGFPKEIAEIATSLFGSSIPNEDITSILCAEIINNLKEYLDTLSDRTFIEEYKSRMFLLGKEINVISPNSTYSAIATDIDDDAHLIVTLPDGSKRVLNAGEISIRPQ